MLAKVAGSNQFKVGTGQHTWSDLPWSTDISNYISSSGSVQLVDNHLEVDFSQMPTDKFETLLKQLRLPIWLTKNTNFYVDGTTGSDVLSEERGLLPEKPFKTIQACVDYVCENYNISIFNLEILIKSGTYEENVTFREYTRSTGSITLRPWNGIDTTLPANLAKTVVISGSPQWYFLVQSEYSIFGLHFKFEPIRNITSNWRPKIIAIDNGCILTIVSCKFEMNLNNVSGNMRILSAGIIGASNNSHVSLSQYKGVPNEFNLDSTTKTTAPVHVDVFAISNNALVEIIGQEAAEESKILIQNLKCDAFIRCAGAKFSHSIASGCFPLLFEISGIINCQRYVATEGGIINSGGQGPNYFPGNIAGTVESETFSWYK